MEKHEHFMFKKIKNICSGTLEKSQKQKNGSFEYDLNHCVYGSI